MADGINTSDDRILLAHGSGGVQMHALLRDLFLPAFDNPALREGGDSAVIDAPDGRLAFTTDSYVVHPLEFPGGCIGDLAVNGTINDLAMMGARPLALSAAFILEEGFPRATLDRMVRAMREASLETGVAIVTGDTKVVQRGGCDGMFITTAGVGSVPAQLHLQPSEMREDDVVILSGDIGAHGIAVASMREGMRFDTTVRSDTQSLHLLVRDMLATGARIRVMRDPTRGGLATTLNELARASALGIVIEEESVPIAENVRGACDLLGFDPLHLANEGVLCAVAPASDAPLLLDAMHARPEGMHARIIGRVVHDHAAMVRMLTSVGGSRIITMLSGDLLPRIC